MKKLHYHIKKSADVSDLPKIKGADFEKDVKLDALIESFGSTGLQASELSHAIEVVKMMIREKVPIFLSFTSNMISSGIRDIITYLTKNNKIQVLCTSAGGIEEDALKVFEPFRLGSFYVAGDTLFESGICRIGNIYATTNHYSYFEQFMQDVFNTLYQRQKSGERIGPSDLAHEIGSQLKKQQVGNYRESYLYHAYKNNIPVYCPGFVDGAIGDMLYFYKNKHPDFVIDVSADHKKIIDYVLSCEKTAAIVLGGGIAKHYVLNANIFKEGIDYTVFISTAQFHDGSDSGGNFEEAISWAKVKKHSPRIKVYCDASIAFPILVAATFAKN